MSHALVGRIVTLIGDAPKGATRYRVLNVEAHTYMRRTQDPGDFEYERPRVAWWLLAMKPDGELVTLDADNCRVAKGSR